MNFELEVCAGSLASAINADSGGAHRIELCDNLAEGGTTPSPGIIIQAVKRMKIPVFVLIRPRSGDFLYSDAEFEAMKEDILFCKEHKAKGVVLGILNPEGDVDAARTAALVQLARPMQVTFHRAFDRSRDPFRALEDIISLGIERILTSGQEASALQGAGLIAELIRKAAGRIIIMPGAGINEGNILEIKHKTGAVEFHASLQGPVKSTMQSTNDRISLGRRGQEDDTLMETNAQNVWQIINRFNSEKI